MKSKITITAMNGGYLMDYAGRYGGGGSRHIPGDAIKAAGVLRQTIARYIDTNPEGGEYFAPDEVLEALDQNTVESGPGKGARLSYYASAEALRAIQSEREKTGDSQSGAINALVLRGSKP